MQHKENERAVCAVVEEDEERCWTKMDKEKRKTEGTTTKTINCQFSVGSCSLYHWSS